MASENKFAHISVNSGDDDVVIHAGATAAAQPEAEEGILEEEWNAEAPEEGAEAYSEGANLEEAYGIEGQYGDGEGHASAPSVGVGGNAAGAQAAVGAESAAHAKDAYRETTLDDIQGSRMGTTQKVVIVLAIVLIIAIVIWQIAFNG